MTAAIEAIARILAYHEWPLATEPERERWAEANWQKWTRQAEAVAALRQAEASASPTTRCSCGHKPKGTCPECKEYGQDKSDPSPRAPSDVQDSIHHLRLLLEKLDGKYICTQVSDGFIDEGFIVASDYNVDGILALLSRATPPSPTAREVNPYAIEEKFKPLIDDMLDWDAAWNSSEGLQADASKAAYRAARKTLMDAILALTAPDKGGPDSLAKFAADLASQQEPLGEPFASILHDNLDKLHMISSPMPPIGDSKRPSEALTLAEKIDNWSPDAKTPLVLIARERRLAADALRSVAESDSWRPIETAPLDGTRFLAWNSNWSDVQTAQWYGARGFCLTYDLGPFKHAPTHWMPLPATPSKDTAA